MLNVNELPSISSALPWHGENWARIDAQLCEGMLPHALMLVGQQFVGKSQFALALARRLLCKRPNGTLNCGQCHACELSASGNHGDFLWVEPEEKSRVIKIDQVRGVARFCQKTAAYGTRKIVVINPAGSMNINAFNALLKSLEEPARETYLILVCHRLDGIPVTIRSRCHILRLGNADKTTSLTWLDTYTQNRAHSEALLALTGGLPLMGKEIYLASTAEAVAKKKSVLDALLLSEINVPEASAFWGETDASTLLEYLTADLQQRITNLAAAHLITKNGRATFHLLDEIATLRRAVNAGANPNKPLLIDAVLSKYHRYLAGPVSDSISAKYREDSV